MYRYRYTDRHELRATGRWWHRTYVRDFMRPVPRTVPVAPRKPV
ncbi:hypothetical protein NKH18_46650 [Streptomyces sp. M10(2022)]